MESVLLHLLAKTWISCVYTDFMLVSCKEQSKAWLLLRALPAVTTALQSCPRVRSCKCQSPASILLLLVWMKALARLEMRLMILHS